ncbi:CCR4-NOT transcription complex subunit 4 [Paragonimus westermani]|uniref:CCR4-NOT transcription complex subunit 4 n=1 Tax=Paragonimus westermani TaxID=34504 RepID=A0A5J4P3B0_9TREM|nr:CCR4-NOT transcription complex subunit 4 [Paragonimus westermani]
MASEEGEVCPLCMEPMEADDLAFYPCDCRYQVCRFCWAKIINEENGLCPACRKEYNSEKPALYKPVSETDDTKLKSNRKRKDHMKKTKLNAEMLKLLPELRVVQPNLIFVVGLPAWICKDKEVLKGLEYFGRYGKVFKVEINQNQTFGGPQGQPSFSAYITFCRSEDAMRSIRELDQGMLHGRPLRVSLGTTKYCSQFLRGTKCTKHECMYLHELGDPAASFTKEEMQAGKHTEYMNKLLIDYSASTQSVSNSGQNDSLVESLDSGSASSAIFPKNPSGNDPNPGSTKEPPLHPAAPNRGRHRVDSTIDRTSLSSPTKSTAPHHQPQSRQQSDPDGHSTNTVSDGRKHRIHRSDYSSYSDYLPPELTDGPTFTTAKENAWNRSATSSNYVSSELHKTKSVASTFGQSHSNGLDGKSTRDHLRTNDSRRSHPNRSEHGRTLGNHKPSTDCLFTSLDHPTPTGGTNSSKPNITRATTTCTTSISNNNNSNANSSDWRCHLSTSDSCGHLASYGDEPVDIDFDPFRESQQGLAELLAAEVNKLGVAEEDSMTGPYSLNGHFTLPGRDTSDPLNFSCSPRVESAGVNNGFSDYTNTNGPAPFAWLPNFTHSDTGIRGDPNSRNSHCAPATAALFSPRIYPPPPGFEENVRVLQQTDSSLFSSPNPSLMEFGLSESPCSPMSQLAAVGCYGNGSNLAQTNGPLDVSSPAFPFGHPPPSGKIDMANFETNNGSSATVGSPHSPMQCGAGTMYRPSYPSADGSPIFRLDQALPRLDPQQQQAMANLFAATFNTASAMLNSRCQSAPGDSKSASRCSPNFDLTTFFSQLVRHAPFLQSLGAHTSLNAWTNMNGNTRTPGGNGLPETVLDSSAALSAAASMLFPPVHFQSRSTDLLNTDESSSGPDGSLFSNYNFPPGLPKQAPFPLHLAVSEASSDKSLFNNLPNPSAGTSKDSPEVSSSVTSGNSVLSTSTWKPSSDSNSPIDLLQQLWRSGSGVQSASSATQAQSSLFDAHLSSAYGFSTQNGSPTDQPNSHRQQILRDPSLHPASNTQCAD